MLSTFPKLGPRRAHPSQPLRRPHRSPRHLSIRPLFRLAALGTPAHPSGLRSPPEQHLLRLTGILSASGSDQYVFHALAGQMVSIDLTFREGKAILAVWGADGNVLLTDHAEVSNFQRVLPKTQDYYIAVKGRPEGGTLYSMTLSIPATASAAKRIEFAPGSITSTVSGQLNPGELGSIHIECAGWADHDH